MPHASIHSVSQVRALDAIRGKLLRTRAPDGREIRLQPMAVDLDGAPSEYGFPPRFGEHTEAVLAEAGYAADDLAELRQAAVIPA